ncbi:MAG: asparagine synthase-related protein [Photobacterium frigidiphilum]|uniref:asparagine synthase-related protein n=1 Tax=Photobacterium frigidiphilum TaxID=264736 RepID=UPI003001305D
MSGIGGIVLAGRGKIELRELERMCNALRPYGPDRQQSLVRPGIGMLHSLMRITPEDFFEHQPLAAPSGILLCADARIDNRQELAGKLSIHPAQLKTLPDSHLILKAYEHWGEACPEHLLGDFAFAIWDPREQKLFMARDHFGVRSLNYCHKGDFFAFSNDIKALLALPQISDELNQQKLAEFAVLLHANASASFYQDISRLPAGHSLTLVNNKLRLRRYYRLEDNIQDVYYAKHEEYAEALKEQLNQAVLCRLRSAYPIGCELSGGLDSTSVAGLAAIELAKQGKSLETFTAVPPLGYKGAQRRGWELDERPYVQAFSDHYRNINIKVNTNYFAVDPAEQNLFSILEETFSRDGFPGRSVNTTWVGLLGKQAHNKGIRVMLNGGMGNATISWSGKCLYSELLQQGRWAAWCHAVYQTRREQHCSLKSLLAKSVTPFIPDPLWAGYRRIRDRQPTPWSSHSLLNPEMAQQQNIASRYTELGSDPYYRPLANGRDNRIRQLLKMSPVDSHHKNSAMRALTGVERRDPTLDKRLVEFCFGIGEAQYCRNGNDRTLIRQAMKGVLPEVILHRKSKGMQPPHFSNHFHEPASELWQQLEQLKNSEQASQFLDLPRMEKMLQRSLQGQTTEAELGVLKRSLKRAYSIGGFICYVNGSND